jgi:hypothetical protein
LNRDEAGLVVADGPDVELLLPETAPGLAYVIALGPNGRGVTVRPRPIDQIIGLGFRTADGKGIVLAAKVGRAGDAVTLVADGAVGWFVSAVIGAWSAEG